MTSFCFPAHQPLPPPPPRPPPPPHTHTENVSTLKETKCYQLGQITSFWFSPLLEVKQNCFETTADSRYLEVQGTLWNTSKYPYIDKYQICRFEEKQIEQPHFTNEYVVWLLKLEIYWKYCGTEDEQFLLCSTIFCYVLLDFHVSTGTRFSFRDKRLFEISRVEITRVDLSPRNWIHSP